MQIVASLTDPAQAAAAQAQGAQIIELRFDLMDGDPVEMVRQCKKRCPLPVIATLRSAQEGGRYFGSPEEWAEKIAPVIPLVDYVDVEQPFAREAGPVIAAGRAIIASHHEAQMMPLHVLFVLEQELRAYGDIPKIIVTPNNEDDLIDLIAFTRAAKKPGSTRSKSLWHWQNCWPDCRGSGPSGLRCKKRFTGISPAPAPRRQARAQASLLPPGGSGARCRGRAGRRP
ncbi:MAG: type I 3-dehydroquinate dehydratase [Methanoregula sp.]|uniref:type I 3-dehydroquinate dehydratase n=1 Tax=Methanoregula sp. TaxID=2052170 RepID=UPI003C25DDA1